ncbi:peptidylprolyl isomerase [Magnetospira sp. QH-2]|uniref:peptidylprolyl isomerase n=1 Tax=Magnetospira sp. (strain QH-2) TaxID=1288970 RepID=UPI0003E80EF8|nr:peptidylprolyl isomerase [Magnetospira sp. QH-2]CCQ74650.1 Putative parvulin-type peptidyl-prolyl cis-trans isomerase [Magnetospira sp. QH-2]
MLARFARSAAVCLVAATAFHSAALAADPTPETVVARVNGEAVKFSDILVAREQLPAKYRQVPIDQVFEMLQAALINNKLLTVEARLQGLQDLPAIKERVQRVEDQLIARQLLLEHVNSQITDALMQESYQKVVAQNSGIEELHTRHILVNDEALAADLIAQLNKGADFADLAVNNSTGPTGPKGGDLGWTRLGSLVPEFEAAALTLQKGSHTPAPVKTQFGWHVIKMEDRRLAPVPTYEEAEPAIRAKLSNDIAVELTKELMTRSHVERFNLDGTPMAAPAAQ